MATLEVDPSTSFKVAIHASYHNDFFLLRARVLVNGETTTIKTIKEDEYEGPALNFRHSGSTVSTKLYLIARTASLTLVRYGIYHIDTFYYEQSPLFHVVFSSESSLENFILAIGEVKSALEPKLQSLFSHNLKTESAQKLVVEVQPDLYFVSPNRQETKGAELHLVTAENCSTFVTRWRNSKLFDFGALYQEEAKPPKLTSQPTSQNDVLPGKAVTFSVQATGTQPLNYQWQSREFGKKGEKYGWQNLSGDSGTFQVMEVKASNAGYYRCVVSNSGGSETSQCASLTVDPEVCDLEGELHDVVDWIGLGLCLGIKLPELKIIEANYPNDLKRRRTQMFEEWQKKVTPTWSAVVQALVGIGMRRLASELAQKHGIPPPKLPDDDPLDQLENVQEEEATVSKLREDIQKLRSDLIQQHEKLVDAEESKNKANKEARDAAAKLEESHENVQKIIQEKKKLEMELKVKERECQLLCAMQEKDEEFNQFLKIKVDEKEKEIKSLKEELQMKESGLQFAVQELQTQQEKLSKARKKLKKKHKEVMQLQKEKEELACSYNSEMERVSKLVQITSSLTSDREEMKQKLSIVEAESELKSQQIEVCSADINHLSENIKTLSSSLQKEEARAVQLQSELQAREQVASTQLLTFVKLTTQIAELERKLQEAEEQKQQAELERKATVKEMKAKENLKAQLHAQLDELPKVTDQPKSLSKVSPGKPAMFTLQATGTEPLRYRWQWNPAEEEGGSEGWQTCPAEWSDGATLTIPSVQKSNEGSYCCVISNCAGSQTSTPAKLELSLQLRWRRCRDMECGMTYYPHCVVLERRVYVGGGYTRLDDDAHIVFKYDPDTDNWSRLPRYQYRRFAISIINSHLTLVGGYVDRLKPTNQLAVYEPSSQHWTYPYNPMPTPRYGPAVVVYDKWLLVAGGCAGPGRELATVELLNTSTNLWLASASSLPMSCSRITSATDNNNAYLVMNSKQVYRVSLPDIVSQTVDQSTASESLWCCLPDTPLSCSAAISLLGYLIAVGGLHGNHTRRDIYLYQPESKQWAKVGDLPNARYFCSCVVLPSGELLVAGGEEGNKLTSRVDVASVLN